MVTFYRIGASPLIVTQIFAVVFFGFPHGHVCGYDLFEGSLCKLADGAPGVCTILDQCTSVYQGLLTNTLPYEDVVKNRCGFVKNKEIVCCKDRQPTGRTTPRVPTPTRSEFPVNKFSGKGSSSGHDDWPSVSRPLVENNKLNVERIGDQTTRSDDDENDGKISSRFFLGSLLSSRNNENTFQNTQVQQQQINVRCINNLPPTTTPLPVQIRPRIFGILNFNKPPRTTIRPSVLSPVLDALKPIKEIPLNFISAIGNRRNGINVQGQFNINSGQSATFGDTNELCVGTNYEPIQGSQNPNNFVPSNSVRNPNLNQNEEILNNPNSPMSASTNSMIANQLVTSVQNPKQNQNHNIGNIPNPATFVPFTTSNSLNGNQPAKTFQPVPMPNVDSSQSLNNWSNPKLPMSVPLAVNSFRSTSPKSFPETNPNWDTNENSPLEPWMVEVFRTTTIATTASTIGKAQIDASQLEPWMVGALEKSTSTVPNQQDNQNPKPNTNSLSLGKSEALQMPPHSAYDPWMLEAVKEDIASTQFVNNPDQSKTDIPIIPLLQNSENTTTSFGDSVLDPWMKEALLDNNNTTTTTTTLKPQINNFDNSANSSSTDKNAGFELWMIEALKETNKSSSSSDDINRSRKDLSKPDALKNSEIVMTTKKSIFGDSILDPWMKEALLDADESKSIATSTQRIMEDSTSDEQIPPSVTLTSKESTNGNNAFEPWMLSALGEVSSTKPNVGSLTKAASERPSEDTELDPWIGEDKVDESFDRGSDNKEAQSSRRGTNFLRDHNRTRSRDTDNSKSFSGSSNASLTLPTEEVWIWDSKIVANNTNSSKKSNKSSEDDVNYWMNEALKQKLKPVDDNSGFQNNQLGRENLGVGNTTDRINFDLFNEIFDIPENRPSNPIGPRNSRRADDVCAKYRDEFGASLTYQILGGTAALLGEFPHMGALGYQSTAANREYDWNCGATLISDLYLLTAAHCITRTGPTLARLGKISIDTNDDNAIPADYIIEESIKHPNYTNARQYHDIALVKLSQKVNFTENIRPACLDTSQASEDSIKNYTVSGWGTVSLRTRSRSAVLLKANLKSVPLTSCNQSHVEYEQRNRKLPFGLTEAQMCAFDPDLVKDACEGDSGGPLQIVDDSGMATIYGVTSFGVSCASQIPGVYARVSHYVDWIESIVWP